MGRSPSVGRGYKPTVLQGPGVRIVLDAREIDFEDPGAGTPAMVFAGKDSSTYNAVYHTGEIGDNGRQLDSRQYAWVERQGAIVDEFLEQWSAGRPREPNPRRRKGWHRLQDHQRASYEVFTEAGERLEGGEGFRQAGTAERLMHERLFRDPRAKRGVVNIYDMGPHPRTPLRNPPRRVRAGATYRYDPVGVDLWDPKSSATPGQEVRVVNLYGAPPANTMGHAHIESLSGKFLGLVLTNSLQSRGKR